VFGVGSDGSGLLNPQRGHSAGVLLPYRNGQAAGDDHAAVSAHDSTIYVQVAAVIPLLRAALEHAVRAAGLHIAPRDGLAMVTLRTSDQPTTGAALDISVDGEHVTIAVTEAPSPEVWAATLNLLQRLLDGN
jgi:hypothetical protein